VSHTIRAMKLARITLADSVPVTRTGPATVRGAEDLRLVSVVLLLIWIWRLYLPSVVFYLLVSILSSQPVLVTGPGF